MFLPVSVILWLFLHLAGNSKEFLQYLDDLDNSGTYACTVMATL